MKTTASSVLCAALAAAAFSLLSTPALAGKNPGSRDETAPTLPPAARTACWRTVPGKTSMVNFAVVARIDVDEAAKGNLRVTGMSANNYTQFSVVLATAEAQAFLDSLKTC